jgi:histidine triad (HIT) family protein
MTGANDPDCRFCRIIAGDEPGFVVLDEPAVVAFLDVRPLFAGHVLVVPRQHVDTLADLPDDLVEPLFTTVRLVSVAMERALGSGGSFVAINNKVSQSQPHLHVHVAPRTKGDGLRGFFWPRTRYGPGEAEAVAATLRNWLASADRR